MAVKVCSGNVALTPAPIRSDWVLEGSPCARNSVLARSHDRTTLTMVWDCSAGRFRWVYDQDESIHIIEGGATLTFADGQVATVGPGDVVFFPAGSSATWEVKTYVRKFAVFRQPIPRPVALAVKACAKVRAAIPTGRGRLRLAVAPPSSLVFQAA